MKNISLLNHQNLQNRIAEPSKQQHLEKLRQEKASRKEKKF